MGKQKGQKHFQLWLQGFIKRVLIHFHSNLPRHINTIIFISNIFATNNDKKYSCDYIKIYAKKLSYKKSTGRKILR